MTNPDQNHTNRKADTLYCDRCNQPITDDNYTYQNSFNFHKVCPDQNQDWIDDLLLGIKHYWLIPYAPDKADVEKVKTPAEVKATILARHRAAIDRAVAEARVNELDMLMSSKLMSNAWFPELDVYYNQRVAALTPKERKQS